MQWRSVLSILCLGVSVLAAGAAPASAQGGVGVLSGLPGYEVEGSIVTVINGRGGSIAQHNEMWREHARRGRSIRITGDCRSACTLFFGQIARNRVCLGPSARLGFHAGRSDWATAMMWRGYPQSVRAWINAMEG